jgi:hypothetical protein
MTVNILPNNKDNPAGTLGEVELHFSDGRSRASS